MALSTRLTSSLRPALAALRWAAHGQCRGLSTPQGPEPSLHLGGIFPPLTTPFSPTQEVDYAQLEGNLRRYASVPFRGKHCPLSFSLQAPVRSLPATEAVQQHAGSLPASQGCSASSWTLLQGWQPLGSPTWGPLLGTCPGTRVCPCTPPPHASTGLHTHSTHVQACTYAPHIAAGFNLCTAVPCTLSIIQGICIC